MATGQLEINSLADIIRNWEILTDSSVIIEYVYNNYSVYINNVLDDTTVLNVNLFNTLKDLGFLNRLENLISNNAIVQFTIKPILKTAPVLKMLEKLMLLTYEKSYNLEEDINNAITSINYTCYWDREFDYQGTVGLMSYSKCIEIRDYQGNSVFIPYGQNRDFLVADLLPYNKFYNKLLTYYMYLKNITEFDINSLNTLITVNTLPINATVTLEVDGLVSYTNSMYVAKGDTVTYTVSADGYGTVSDSVTIYDNTTLNVVLTQLTAVLTINATPNTASVIFTGEYVSYTSNTVTVYKGTTITYTVSATGYDSITSNATVNEDMTVNVDLDRTVYSLTINPTPSNATVTFSGDYISYTDNTALAYEGSTVSYSVSATDYDTQTGNVTLMQNEVMDIILNKSTVTLTINTTPNNATVIFRDTPYISKTDNSITVNAGTTVNYEVTAVGYVTQSDSIIVNEDTTISVILEETEYFILDSDLTTVGSVNVPPTYSDNGITTNFSNTNYIKTKQNADTLMSATNWEVFVRFKFNAIIKSQPIFSNTVWGIGVNSTGYLYSGCYIFVDANKKLHVFVDNYNTGGSKLNLHSSSTISANTWYTIKVWKDNSGYHASGAVSGNSTNTKNTLWKPMPLTFGFRSGSGSGFIAKSIGAPNLTVDMMASYIKSNGSYVVWNTNILPSS